MHGPGEELLADTGFSRDHNGGIGIRDLFRARKHPLQCAAVADDLFEIVLDVACPSGP